MIWQLVKQDPAVRRLPLMAAICAVVALMSFRPMFFYSITALIWLQCQPERRASAHHAALPILARDLFLARFLSLLCAMWTPQIVGAIVLLGKGRSNDLDQLALLAGMSVLQILVTYSTRVRQISTSLAAPAISMLVVAAVILPSVYFLDPPATILLCAILSAVLFWNVWRQLPLAFEVMPGKAASNHTFVRPVVAEPKTTHIVPLAWRPILRSIFGWNAVFFLPGLLVMASGGEWLFPAIFCVLPIATVVRARWLSSLPFRREILLALTVGPWLLILLMTLAFGSQRNHKPIQITWSEHNRVTGFKTPPGYWSFSPLPEIQAPWGERAQPGVQSFLGLRLYNPYSIGPQNSQEFIAWQFSRATQAVYGKAIPLNEYQGKGIPLPSPLPGGTYWAVNLAVCANWVLLLVNLVVGAMHWRVRTYVPRGESIIALLFFAAMISFNLVIGGSSMEFRGLVNAAMLRLVTLLPRNLVVASAVGLLPLALLCWTAARLFRGVESPPADVLVHER